MKFNIPNNLKNAIENDSLVIFVGAGFSKPLGLPDWNELVVALINAVSKEKAEIASLEPLFKGNIFTTFKVLEVLENYRGKVYDELETILDKNVDYRTADLSIQTLLWKVSTQIFTANYDRAIEVAGGVDKDVFIYDNDNKIRKIDSLKNYVFKIHGDIKNSSKCILFESDYNKLYTDSSGAIFELKSALAHKTVLFIGFSMNDPYVKQVVKFMNDMFNGLNDKNYLVKTNNDSFNEIGIDTLNIDNWSNMPAFLDELISIKNKVTSSKNIEITVAIESQSPVLISQPTNRLNDYPKPDPLFTGREDETKRFNEALLSHRIFAVEGLGGTGKTQLVSKCINDFVEDKSRIIWLHGSEESKFDVFVESAGYGEVLKGEKKTQQAIYSGFKDLIERDERIIFLDNYQSILDTTFTDFLKFAIPYLAKSTIIFISKEEVHIGDSYVHPIKVTGLKEQSIEYALKLRNSRTDFEKISDEQLKVLCDKTEGHPLAIKLCMPLLARGAKAENIISDIGKYKQLQGVEQLTKRIFDEVYNQCSNEEQTILQKLSVFNNKVSIEAIDYINGSDSFILINQLIDKFLLSIDDNNCYSLHPLIRELSNQLLKEKLSIHSLAAEYFSAKRNETLQPALEAEIYYHLAQSNQWELLEKEIENKGRRYILSGQLGLVKELLDNLKKAEINKPIFDIFYGDISKVYGNWEEAKIYYERASKQNNNKVKAEGMIKVGEMLYRKGEIKSSSIYFENALKYCQDNNLLKEEARALNDIGLVSNIQGNFKAGLEKIEASLEIRKAIGDMEGVATCHNNIGGIYDNLQNYSLAIKEYEKAIQVGKIENDVKIIASALNGLAISYSSLGKIDKANELMAQSLSIRKEMGDKEGIGTYNVVKASILQKEEKYNEALIHAEKAFEIGTEIGDRSLVATAVGNMGNIYAQLGDIKNSINKFYEALVIFEDIGDKEKLATSHKNLAYASLVVNNRSQAIKHFMYCLSLENQMEKLQANRTKKKIRDLISKSKEDNFNYVSAIKNVYNIMDDETKKYVPLVEICKEELRLKPPASKNAPCPCGSGKQYKRCHGKAA